MLGGKRLARATPEAVARHGVAHVPEGRGIFAELTVWENLRMGGYTVRRPDFATVLGYFPWLEERRNQQAGTLSGGEQQMLALARAFLSRPRLLMLDEPSLGLAPIITREVFRVVTELNQKEGLAVLVVEQNAAVALDRRAARLRPRDGPRRGVGQRRRAEVERRGADRVPGVLMQTFFQTLTTGLSDGAIYGSLALALVLIYKATEVINFAQGEMAMFTTYIAWALMGHGSTFEWWAFFATLGIAFLGGAALQQTVIRPLERASVLTAVMATIALLVILNGLAAWIWSPQLQFFPSPFPTSSWVIGGVHISKQDVGTFGVVMACVLVLWLFFRFTKLGLAMRAGALNPNAARLMGVRTSWLLALGWGFAAALGAVSGMMVAPTVFLTPNMMQAVLIYAFAAAILGGLESPVGAIAGGLMLGVLLNMLGQYVHPVTTELRLPVALGVLLVVLLIKPAGLFGRVVVRRV